MAIKFDMEKAYDKMDWEFLFQILGKFSFAPQFINWIKECVTTVSFSVLVNNSPTEQFFPKKGLRQGDPLSPYLFILGAEILARIIQNECNNNQDIGVQISKNGTTIPFLSFVDDIIIFAKANSNECEKIKEILNNYCEISSQTVNLNKSAFQTTTNVSTQVKTRIANELQISPTSDLESYLGCPIINGRVNKQTYENMITKSKNQLQKWKANSLSQEGRSLLIKTNLSAKPVYTMQSFMLPKNILQDLDNINKKFYWNKGDKHRPLIHWDEVCRSKKNGGTGIRKAEEVNIALQLKLLWKIIAEPDNVWVQIIKEKYLKEESLMKYKKRVLPLGNGGS